MIQLPMLLSLIFDGFKKRRLIGWWGVGGGKKYGKETYYANILLTGFQPTPPKTTCLE